MSRNGFFVWVRATRQEEREEEKDEKERMGGDRQFMVHDPNCRPGRMWFVLRIAAGEETIWILTLTMDEEQVGGNGNGSLDDERSECGDDGVRFLLCVAVPHRDKMKNSP